MKIGVFDSGIGGEAIADVLRHDFPLHEVLVVNDRAHLPYGGKSVNMIRQLTNNAIQPLLATDLIVIACNSATAAAIDWLRQQYPMQKFIGIEPMIQPAALLSKTGVITVCATPATLASQRYASLKQRYGHALTILEPNCRDWAERIENNSFNKSHILEILKPCIAKNTDIIVLGCTHYHWIKDAVSEFAGPKVTVLEPSQTISQRVALLLDL